MNSRQQGFIYGATASTDEHDPVYQTVTYTNPVDIAHFRSSEDSV